MGKDVSQLEFSQENGWLMYSIRTSMNIAFFMGKLSIYTSNLSTQH